jgi:thiosulfate/3-mercaptopyruvate sulfurtransferase
MTVSADPVDSATAPGPLVSVAALRELVDSGRPPSFQRTSSRRGGPPGPEEFRAGHRPGAVYVDLDAELAAPAGPGVGRHPLPDPADLQAAARSWGLNTGDAVVAYDDAGNLSAARAWWLLRWAGFTDVRLLDGGLAGWRAAGGPIETGEAPAPEPGDVELAAGKLPAVDPDGVDALLAEGVVLLDARPAERYRGDVASIDPKPGHIPGAVSAPTTGNLTPEGTFRTPAELAERFAELGVKPGSRVGVYCGSGVTAAHESLALALAGVDDVVLYPGSWSQWATLEDRPVATGPEPGTPAPKAPLVSARQARERVAAGAVLLDTRSPGGREKTGPIAGAVIVDRDNLDAEFDAGSPDRHPEVAGFDTPIVVVCGSVNGSGPVADALLRKGFVNVVHVEGGAPAWHELD